ncbi:LysR family transcriptional regulator [Agrobacterium sp. ES01]|uniref:LysR family transcriptional regulator n=1 Tax=Agrobacterium sp. ES01 TaxID=3420714 RepID=UPI003D0D19DD
MGENAHMNWDDYRCFLAVAREGSLSAAARSLHVDHTTVGRRLASLEDALGVRLVHRLTRAVMLTDEGRRLADLGLEVETAMQAVLRAAAGARPDIAGDVLVSAPPAFVTCVLCRALPLIKERYPALVPTFVGDIGSADLNRRQADIALRMSRPTQPGLVIRKLFDVTFRFYAAEDFEQSEADWPFVTYDVDNAVLPQMRWLDTVLGGRHIVARSNDAYSQAQAISTGMGVALLPDFVGELFPGIKPLDTQLKPPVREMWLVVHEDLRQAPRIRATMDFLAEVLPGLSPRH